MITKKTILFGDTAFYGLAQPDIQILLPDLDSLQNLVSSSIYHILAFFGLAHSSAPTLVSML